MIGDIDGTDAIVHGFSWMPRRCMIPPTAGDLPPWANLPQRLATLS
jgi:hypothetical protein